MSTVDIQVSTVNIGASTIDQWYKALYHCYMPLIIMLAHVQVSQELLTFFAIMQTLQNLVVKYCICTKQKYEKGDKVSSNVQHVMQMQTYCRNL